MVYKVIITGPAKKDLYAIYRYICDELKEPAIAARLLDKIETEILTLENMPHRIRLVSDELLAGLHIRKLLIENYLAFFKINEKNKTVVIERILYTRRDWMNIL